MRTAFYAGGIIIGVLVFWAAIAGFPPEVSALLCIIVPAVLTGTVGFVWGRHGRPRIRIDFPEAVQPVPQDPYKVAMICAACGHPHQDQDTCGECECAAFVEVS